MYRTIGQRQSDSARKYVDFSESTTALDTIVALAASTLGFSHAMVNVLDQSTIYTLARSGFEDDQNHDFVNTRVDSLCQHVIGAETVVGIADVDNPDLWLTPEQCGVAAQLQVMGLKSYLGTPLRGREGLIIGTLCVLDRGAHPLGDYARETLASFASVLEDQLDTLRDRKPARGRAEAGRVGHALEAGEIVPWFQPVVDLFTGRVVALEALARWQHPSGKVDGPGEFLPLAAESDVVVDIDHAILEAGLAHLAQWQKHCPDLILNSNLSARHIGSSHRLEQLLSIAQASGVRRGSVVFELTESEAYSNIDQVARFVERLTRGGFGVLLDDIGCGYSSLERLLELPVSGFKIDASITSKLGTRAGDAMIKALVGLARDTGQSLTIEGIETPEQMRYARSTGCVLAQGYLWAQPMPAADVLPFLLDSNAAVFRY